MIENHSLGYRVAPDVPVGIVWLVKTTGWRLYPKDRQEVEVIDPQPRQFGTQCAIWSIGINLVSPYSSEACDFQEQGIVYLHLIRNKTMDSRMPCRSQIFLMVRRCAIVLERASSNNGLSFWKRGMPKGFLSEERRRPSVMARHLYTLMRLPLRDYRHLFRAHTRILQCLPHRRVGRFGQSLQSQQNHFL